MLLAEHNAWANKLIFDACRSVAPEQLAEEMDGYDSVLGILQHLVQVESNFLALAQARERERLPLETLDAARAASERVDAAFIAHARSLGADAASRKFLVPWFGFEITLVEGVLQPLTHSHKHRADVSMLLPRLGGAGVEMDLIQFLAESRGSRD